MTFGIVDFGVVVFRLLASLGDDPLSELSLEDSDGESDMDDDHEKNSVSIIDTVDPDSTVAALILDDDKFFGLDDEEYEIRNKFSVHDLRWQSSL